MRFVTVVRAVGKVTFLEVIRDKVLYNVIGVTVLLLALGFLASQLSFVHPERVILDFGLMAVAISCGMIAILVGAGMIAREIQRRTLLVALARPISRLQFVSGKYAGLVGILILNWGLASIGYLAVLYYSDGEFHLSLFIALILLLAQSAILAALAVLFSVFATTSLSVMLTIGIYLVGINASQVRFLATRTESAWAGHLLRGLAAVIPNFEFFNLGTAVTYGLPVSISAFLGSLAYAISLIAICLVISGQILEVRES